jgi:hypothetical protein
MAKKPFKPNDTDKEERTYEPFKGAKLDFIKQLEEKEKKESKEESKDV